MGFSTQEYWSGLPFPSPGDLPHPGIEPGSPALQADSLLSEPPGKSSWIYKLQFFTKFGKSSTIIYSSIFLPLSFSPLFLEIQLHMYENTWYYVTDLWGFLYFLQCFFSLFFKPDTLCCSIFQLTDSSVSSYLLLYPSTEFFISVIILLSSRTPIWFLFTGSTSLFFTYF